MRIGEASMQADKAAIQSDKAAIQADKAAMQSDTASAYVDTIVDSAFLKALPLTDERRYRWGGIEYCGEPWVRNASRPHRPSQGLYNRHIALAASHGMYHNATKDTWCWQRPNLYATTEDLFTQTIVVPYLMPMLENAGAVIFSARERDWQKHEAIVDNDDGGSRRHYTEAEGTHPWQTTGEKGYAYRSGTYRDTENPFDYGTVRIVETTAQEASASTASYQPDIPAEGRYAVYVSYQTHENSVDDATYTVWHKGQPTEVKVNQQMGGSTWVYLGTYEFAKGCSPAGRVTLTNLSSRKGVITTDAVRFGGGMGNIERSGTVSGMPRCLEGARYNAQWAGMPDSVYTQTEELNDYKDDINTRSKMTNYMGGGSCYMPTLQGRKVPFELQIGIHSDAGYSENYDSLTSTMTLCTTNHNKRLLNAGISRYASYELAGDLLATITRDLKALCGDWYNRGILDRNYSESRIPEVPSVILETLSHQNFLDMRMGHDPNFRFTLARAIYKTILRHIAKQHNTTCVVEPLTPTDFRIQFAAPGEAHLAWASVADSLEPTAEPTAYVLYTSTGGRDFDNGTLIHTTSHTMRLTPGQMYRFKIAAVNDGGESMPSEVLCAAYNAEARQTVAIVGGFHRLTSPAIVQRDSLHGFDLDSDPGISLGATYGWVGRQIIFERGMEDERNEHPTGWSNDDFAGKLIAGNDMNYTEAHARAIHAQGKYNIVSCSSTFVDHHPAAATAYLGRCAMADILLGLECDDHRSLVAYKALTPAMQATLRAYTASGGALLVSGAYTGSDMQTDTERSFLSDILKCYHAGTYRRPNNTIYGMGTTMAYHNTINEKHYAALSADIMQPTPEAFAMLLYANGNAAGVAYQGNDYRAITLGFPFECLTSQQKQADIMGGMLDFLLNKHTNN